jgi:hypothetical protein
MSVLPHTAEFFHRKKETLSSRCRECESSRKREYRASNLELVREQERTRYSRVPNKDRERNRDYNRKNPEVSAARRRVRRARVNKNSVEPYTIEQVLEKYGSSCTLCGGEIDLLAPRRPGLERWEWGLHIDHFLPIFAGGADSLENVRPTHGRCNLVKGRKVIVDSHNE